MITPAPWRIKRVATSKINAVNIVGGEPYRTIATLRDVYDNDPFFTEDARLIASAPELLDTLKGTLYLLDISGVSSSMAGMPSNLLTIARIRSLINRIESE